MLSCSSCSAARALSRSRSDCSSRASRSWAAGRRARVEARRQRRKEACRRGGGASAKKGSVQAWRGGVSKAESRLERGTHGPQATRRTTTSGRRAAVLWAGVRCVGVGGAPDPPPLPCRPPRPPLHPTTTPTFTAAPQPPTWMRPSSWCALPTPRYASSSAASAASRAATSFCCSSQNFFSLLYLISRSAGGAEGGGGDRG
jgi:hypothetical protein